MEKTKYLMFVVISVLFVALLYSIAVAEITSIVWQNPAPYNLNFQSIFWNNQSLPTYGSRNTFINSFNLSQSALMNQPVFLAGSESYHFGSSSFDFIKNFASRSGSLYDRSLSLNIYSGYRGGAYPNIPYIEGSYSTGIFMMNTGLRGAYALSSTGYPYYFPWEREECPCTAEEPQQTYETKGLMLLIEFEGTEGLNNFVFELQERGIPSLLIASTNFVTENCENIKTLQKYSVEISGVYPQEAFWDVPYDNQYDAMRTTKETIEACTGKPMRVFGSRYFAYDENTIKAAEALGIPYVLARGTTGARATIYQPKEYNVKIFSVSNVSSEKWGTGSLCDYSYWAREGSPAEFGTELFASLEHDKISPVSHTYLGGLKAAWNAEYLNFFDNADVTWVNLDEFGSIDETEPFAEISVNREVQYTTPKPLVPLDEEPNVDNPCAIDDFPPVSGSGGHVGEKIVVFHNGTGLMCLEFLDFINTINYPVEQHLTDEDGFWDTLFVLKDEFEESEGLTENFGYFPIIFIQDKAYSGFNNDIRDAILSLISG